MYSFPCSQAGYPQGHGNYVILFSVVNYRRLDDRMPPMWTKKCIVEGWWLTASVEWRPPFSDEEWEQRNMRRTCRLLRSPSPSRPPGSLCVCTVLLCAARGGFAFVIWWFSKSPRTSSFWCKKNFKYMFDCFDSVCGKKKTLLCLCFLHRKALACNASELRFRLAYFNFLDYFFGSRALRFSHWYFSFSNCGFSSFSISGFFLLYFFLSLKISFWDRQLQEVSFFTL
jgi:hypothetical protein